MKETTRLRRSDWKRERGGGRGREVSEGNEKCQGRRYGNVMR